jgi:hypothetical protein
MNHIGIDLGSRESQVCVRNSAGDIVEEARRLDPIARPFECPRNFSAPPCATIVEWQPQKRRKKHVEASRRWR